MSNDKIARDVAEAEFDRMCADRRVDTDETAMDGDDLDEFKKSKALIVRSIMRGDFIVGDNGECVYTPPVNGAKAITFYRTTGAALMASDDAADGKNAAKLALVMAEMTKTARGELSKLDIADFNLCSKVAQLFLAAGR